MARSLDEFAELVASTIVAIHGGRCPVTPEDALEQYAAEPELAQTLSGLAYLHEDLMHRKEESERAQAALREHNKELTASRAQLRALNEELSVPIIDVWRRVLLIPVVGTFDAQRAVTMLDRLLAALARQRARFVILDLTGVRAIDTGTADTFMRIIKAVRLLGSEGILAGMQPAVATAIVGLGVELDQVVVMRDTQGALRHCLARLGAD